MKKLVNFYKSKTPRERVMLVSVLWMIALFWFMDLCGAISQANGQIDSISSQISLAEGVLDQADRVKKALARVKANFDPSKTVSAADLQLNVEKCAAEAGLVYALSTTTTKDLKTYKINALTLNCRNADLGALAKFEGLLQQHEPYLYVDKVSYDANSRALDVKYTVVSINL